MPGVYSSVQGDPCTTCLCGNDGRHTDVCMAVTCFRPQCPAGTILTLTPGTCCDYECKPLENGKLFSNYFLDCMKINKYFFQFSNFPGFIESKQIFLNFPSPVCIPGLQYTAPDTPCVSCLCDSSGFPTGPCVSPGCIEPNCLGERY